jgi:hypothetical protein
MPSPRKTPAYCFGANEANDSLKARLIFCAERITGENGSCLMTKDYALNALG